MSKNGASILVVDDEREIVRALRRSLSAHGYTVLTASSGEEAVEIVARQRPIVTRGAPTQPPGIAPYFVEEVRKRRPADSQ